MDWLVIGTALALVGSGCLFGARTRRPICHEHYVSRPARFPTSVCPARSMRRSVTWSHHES